MKKLRLYIDDTQLTAVTIDAVTDALKDLKNLEYVRIWHNPTHIKKLEKNPKNPDDNFEVLEEMSNSVDMLRMVLNKELKLWRYVSSETLT